MRARDEIDERIRRIGATRIVTSAKASKCAGCIYVGVPTGTMHPACCDESSDQYHKKITHIKKCRRWKR